MQSVLEREKSEHHDRPDYDPQTRLTSQDDRRKEQLISELVRSNDANMAKCKGCRGGR